MGEARVDVGILMTIIYRRMRHDECDEAAQLHRLVGRDAWAWTPDLTTLEQEQAMYRDTVFAHCEVHGAFEGERLLGFIATLPGWIEHFYVATGRQREGIGTKLISIVMAAQSDLQLWTYQANQTTRRFYELHGFVVAEMTDGTALPEKEPNVRYHWQRH